MATPTATMAPSHHICEMDRYFRPAMHRRGTGARVIRSTTWIVLIQMVMCGGAHLQRQLGCVHPTSTTGTRRIGGTTLRRSSRNRSCCGSNGVRALCFAASPQLAAVKRAHVPRGTSSWPQILGLKSSGRRRNNTLRRRTEGSAGVVVVAVAGEDLFADPRPRGTRGDRERRIREEERDREAQQQPPHVQDSGACKDPMKTRLGRELEVCRVINGLCQGPLDDTSGNPIDALRSMDRLAEAGLTTFQLGNSVGGGRVLAERRAGSYLKSAAGAASGSQEVRFLNTLSLRPGVPVTRRAVEAELELSLSRMGVERLDLVQLCWKDFEDRYFLDALCFLEESECVSNVGVCGFPTEPLALAAKNGFTIVSNLVTSSLIRPPVDSTRTSTNGQSGEKSSSSSGSTGETITLARQCREQGVALISSGASLGGFAADEWLHRSPPTPSGSGEEELAPGARQALSEIFAWGSGSRSSTNSDNGTDQRDGRLSDPWHLYQNKLLPELQAVARKHGRGLSPADVATAFQLYRKPVPSYLTGIPGSSETHRPGTEHMGQPETVAGSRVRTIASDSSTAAVLIPVRVNSAGSRSARRSAEADEDRVSGRRGAELAEMLDVEDVERIAEAVAEGATSNTVRLEGSALGWEQDLSEGAERGREGNEERMLRGGEVGWEGPTIFL